MKKLFHFKRFDYEVWSDEKLIGEGFGLHSVALRTVFENFTHELSKSEVGDGFTFIVRRAV